MKHFVVLLALLGTTTLSFGQKGFGLDGTMGFGLNGSEMINPLLLEGRVQWNDFVSTNLGLGLWNSGYKAIWNTESGTTATIYKLTDNQALPTVQLSLKGQYPIGYFLERELKLFVEPKMIFLPFSARTSYLNELYYTISYNGSEKIVTPGPSEDNVTTSYKSGCKPRLYYGIQLGLLVNVYENFDLSLSYGYTNIDLFMDLRGQSIKGFELNNYLPVKGMQLINLSLQYNFNLN